MALRDLETTQMVEVSRRWSTSPMKELIVSLPIVGVYLPVIVEAHQGLTLKPKKQDPNKEAAELRGQQITLDARHDPLLRGSFLLLSALSELTLDPEAKKRYLKARETFHPFGLSGTQKPFREEAGAAELIERELDNENRELLSLIPLPKEMTTTPTLLEAVTERIQLGKQIGVLEDQRDAVLEEAAPNTDDPTANEARLSWIDAVATFTRLLKSAKAPAKDVEVLLAPLQDAEAIAAKRKASAPTPAPVAPAGEK